LEGFMARRLKYVIFCSRWGWFGLWGGERGLLRMSLPIGDRDKAKRVLLKGIEAASYDKRLFPELVAGIRAYFEGLITCRQVGYGRTVSYGRLAELVHRPGAGQAVGNVLAKNPVPLIIPCHRVIRSDGKIGGFSAPGGISLKQRMLELEARTEDS